MQPKSRRVIRDLKARLREEERRSAANLTMASYTVAYLDLETTGLSVYHADVIQIGVMCMNYKFSRYIMPQVPIEPGATNKNGLTTYGGRLYKGNVPVSTVTLAQACGELITFLRGFTNRVILVAHNGSNFDFPLLVRDMKRVGLLGRLQAVVAGTVDSIPVFRNKLPHWHPNDFGLSSMAASLGVSSHGAHDALRDAEILQSICQKLYVTVNDMWPYLKPLQ